MKKRNMWVLALVLIMAMPLWATGKTESQADSGKGMVVSYNTPNQWANWGAVLKAFTAKTGITAPSDPKNSGQTMAALEAEAKVPSADTAYFGIVFGIEAAKKDLLEGYKPTHFDEIPSNLKDANGQWFTIHQGSIAFIVNTAELKGIPYQQAGKIFWMQNMLVRLDFLIRRRQQLATQSTQLETLQWVEPWTIGILE